MAELFYGVSAPRVGLWLRVAAKGVMSATRNETLVLRAIQAICNRGDLDVADEFFTGDYVNQEGVIADLVDGPEDIKISAALLLAFPRLRVVVAELTTDMDIVLLKWAAYGNSAPASDGGPVPAGRNTLKEPRAAAWWVEGSPRVGLNGTAQACCAGLGSFRQLARPLLAPEHRSV